MENDFITVPGLDYTEHKSSNIVEDFIIDSKKWGLGLLGFSPNQVDTLLDGNITFDGYGRPISKDGIIEPKGTKLDSLSNLVHNFEPGSLIGHSGMLNLGIKDDDIIEAGFEYTKGSSKSEIYNKYKLNINPSGYVVKAIDTSEDFILPKRAGNFKLKDLSIPNSKLLTAYPDLRDLTIKVDNYDPVFIDTGDISTSEILLNFNNFNTDIPHEIQHAIQQIEGTTNGIAADVFPKAITNSIQNYIDVEIPKDIKTKITQLLSTHTSDGTMWDTDEIVEDLLKLDNSLLDKWPNIEEDLTSLKSMNLYFRNKGEREARIAEWIDKTHNTNIDEFEEEFPIKMIMQRDGDLSDKARELLDMSVGPDITDTIK